MFRKSIKQKIAGVAAGLIVLAVITSILSMVMAARVGHLLDELANRYVAAYGELSQANANPAFAAAAQGGERRKVLRARANGLVHLRWG